MQEFFIDQVVFERVNLFLGDAFAFFQPFCASSSKMAARNSFRTIQCLHPKMCLRACWRVAKKCFVLVARWDLGQTDFHTIIHCSATFSKWTPLGWAPNAHLRGVYNLQHKEFRHSKMNEKWCTGTNFSCLSYGGFC